MIRTSFVSNSSSSSFIIGKTPEISELQLRNIRELKNSPAEYTQFKIGETSRFIYGYTEMDNLGIERYLIALGIPKYLIQLSDHIGWVMREFLQEIMENFETWDLK
jgi:hypothetical protein